MVVKVNDTPFHYKYILLVGMHWCMGLMLEIDGQTVWTAREWMGYLIYFLFNFVDFIQRRE